MPGSFLRVALLAVVIGGTLSGSVDARELNYAISPSNKPPFWFKENGAYKGIMVDVAREIAAKLGHTIKVVGRPPKRGQLKIIMPTDRATDIDFSNFAIEWVEEPENYLFTEPVTQVDDIFLSLAKSPVNVRELQDLAKEHFQVGTHRGYIYPTLAPYFQSGFLSRDDAASELAIMKKLLYGRNRVSAISYQGARWYVKKHQYQGLFYFADYTLASASLRFVFRKSNGATANAFDHHLNKMKHSGELQDIITSYLP